MWDIEDSSIYMTVRTLSWIGVVIAQVASISNANGMATARPMKLTYGIAVSSALYALRDLWLLIFTGNESKILETFVATLTSVADACFLALLLLISAGYCITTTRLAHMKSYTYLLPAVYLAANLVYNIVNYSLDPKDTVDDLSSVVLFVLLATIFTSTASLVFSWIYILDNTERITKALNGTAPAASGPEASPGSVADSDEGGVHAIAMEEAPPGFEALTDQPTTVAEAVERAKKARLMRSFLIAVTAYMVGVVLVMLAWFGGDPLAVYTNIFTVLLNALLLLFEAALAWVFRTRDDSPYLLLGEHEGAVPLDTALEMEDAFRRPRVEDMEMGVVDSGDPPRSPRHSDAAEPAEQRWRVPTRAPRADKPAGGGKIRLAGPGKGRNGAGAAAPSKAQPGKEEADVDAAFTLDDEEPQ